MIPAKEEIFFFVLYYVNRLNGKLQMKRFVARHRLWACGFSFLFIIFVLFLLLLLKICSHHGSVDKLNRRWRLKNDKREWNCTGRTLIKIELKLYTFKINWITALFGTFPFTIFSIYFSLLFLKASHPVTPHNAKQKGIGFTIHYFSAFLHECLFHLICRFMKFCPSLYFHEVFTGKQLTFIKSLPAIMIKILTKIYD